MRFAGAGAGAGGMASGKYPSNVSGALSKDCWDCVIAGGVTSFIFGAAVILA